MDIGTLDPATNFQTFHTTPALIRIDPLTGAATKIADLPGVPVQLVNNPNSTAMSPFGPFISGLDFAPNGTLYGVTLPTHFGGESHLVTIDPTNGKITDIGSTGVQSLNGITYVQTVPEPASLALFVVGGLAFWGRSRRRASTRRKAVRA